MNEFGRVVTSLCIRHCTPGYVTFKSHEPRLTTFIKLVTISK